jgi:serine/threonine-protein kinase
LVAVAPFDVLAPNLELWREGLVDLLSRNLDGAGPLRTVPPSAVIRRWKGRADAPSAVALGRGSGARLAVFGQLVATRGDSVRLTSTLFDVGTGRAMGEFEIRDLATNMDRVSDSLTVALLSELGRSRPIGAVQATALRSTSLPALKAFLQGEQYFRRTSWDSALAAYQRVVAIDSGFALAWRRMAIVVGWRVIGADSISLVYSLRAAALNHGLAPHDSMLITAESLSTALYKSSNDTLWRAHQARLHTTLEEATRRYPADPEAWYELGDARFHFPLVGRTGLARVLEPFDRAIEIDSAFGESYLHPISLAIQLDRPNLARKYLAGYLAHAPETMTEGSSGYPLTDRILAAGGHLTPELEAQIDRSSADALFGAYLTLLTWADSGEAVIRIARAIERSPRSVVPLYNDPRFRRALVGGALGERGHLREAWRVGNNSIGQAGPSIAVLGGAPAERAGPQFREWLMNPPLVERPSGVPNGFNIQLFDALPWWAARRDTVSLAVFAARMRSLMPDAGSDLRTWLNYGALSADAYRALAKADTASALQRFTSLPDTVCPCEFDQIVTAQLLAAKGRNREAAAVFDGQYPSWFTFGVPLWRLERARANERAGNLSQAVEDYQYVVGVWRYADPELQPYVKEAKEALSRLSTEPRR